MNEQRKATLENWMLAQRLTGEQVWELEFTSEVQQSNLKIEQASYPKNIWKLKLEGKHSKNSNTGSFAERAVCKLIPGSLAPIKFWDMKPSN